MMSVASGSATVATASDSTLSALTPPFSMVPSAVLRRSRAAADGGERAAAAETGKRNRTQRARPRRKKKQSEDAAEPKTQADEQKAPKSKPKKKKIPVKKAAEKKVLEQKEAEEGQETCLLCADPIEFFAVGECNHHGICSKCSMRMRLLLDDRNCPMCKQPLEKVVVSKTPCAYESFELWGDAAGPESVLDELSEMIFVDCRAHYYALRSLREFACRLKRCKEVKHSLGQLKEHLRRDHGVEFCELCLTHQSFFIQEQEVFSKGTLKSHDIGRTYNGGQKHANTGKDFHPMCKFCRKRFYGDKELYEHLERDHFKCHICKVENEYFRNYASLETHFRREHHLCEDPRCLAMRFVVFPDDVEYQAHMSNIHGAHNRLQVNFQVARGGQNPVGHSPAPDYVPDHWNYGVSYHQPAPRLEEAFPALPTPSGPVPPPVIAPAISRPSSTRTQGPPPSRRMSTPPRGQIVRNQRLAQALGVSRPGLATGNTAAFEEEMKTPNYSEQLIEWGKANTSYLLVVERRLERIVQEPSCHSVNLRPMPSEERARMHELAAFYGVVSESFGEDAHRRVSFFKGDNARVPSVTLSTQITNMNRQAQAARASSRLKFLPLQGATPQAAPPIPARPPVPVYRGWEHIEPRRAPVVPDAWSDDEQDDESGRGESSSGSTNAQEQSEAVAEKPAFKEAAAGGDADEGAVDENSVDTDALKAKVAAIQIDEEEWE